MFGPIGAQEPDEPWHGRQPKYDSLVMRGPRRFALTARLPSGERIEAPLRSLTLELRPDGRDR
jgi:hypothetical protein